MKKAIVSGGAGFIGRALVQNLTEKGVRVIVIEKPGKEIPTEIKRLNVKVIECDLKETFRLSDLIEEREFDVFYQFAWEGLEGADLLNYETQIDNVKWIMQSIITAKQLGCRKFIGAGTFTQEELLTREGRLYQTDKHKFYRAAEFMCDTMGRSVASEEEIEFFWPKITNIYGPGEISPRFINTLIRKLQQGLDMPLSAGKQLYDFLYVDDAAEAFFLIGEKGVDSDEYTIGSGKPKPLREYLEIVQDTVSSNGKLQFGELQYNGLMPKATIFDITELQQLGFFSKVSFMDGVTKTANWLERNHQDGN